MSLRQPLPDIPDDADGFAPPIDEARREALRNDPSVIYHHNPNPPRRLEYKPVLRVEVPFEPSELIDGDDEEDSQIFSR